MTGVTGSWTMTAGGTKKVLVDVICWLHSHKAQCSCLVFIAWFYGAVRALGTRDRCLFPLCTVDGAVMSSASVYGETPVSVLTWLDGCHIWHVSSLFLLVLSVADAGYVLMRMFKNLESASEEELYSHRPTHLHVLCHSIFQYKNNHVGTKINIF